MNSRPLCGRNNPAQRLWWALLRRFLREQRFTQSDRQITVESREVLIDQPIEILDRPAASIGYRANLGTQHPCLNRFRPDRYQSSAVAMERFAVLRLTCNTNQIIDHTRKNLNSRLPTQIVVLTNLCGHRIDSPHIGVDVDVGIIKFCDQQTPLQELRVGCGLIGQQFDQTVAKAAGIPNSGTIRDIEASRDAKLSNIEAVAKVLGLRLELQAVET